MPNFFDSFPSLPNRFVSCDYNLALFFDFMLRSNSEFFQALQEEFGVNVGLTVLSSNGFTPLKKLEREGDWGKEIAEMFEELISAAEYHGVCVVEENERWLIAQYLDISMGVALFKGSEPEAMALFEKLRISDWFFGIEYVREAANDPFSGLVRDYGENFLRILLENYSAGIPDAGK